MNRTAGILIVAILVALGIMGTFPVFAADWPTKTIRIVVPSPPGSATDLMARLLSDRLPAVLGQPVVVDNRPGGATNIASEHVARQSPDGYTLLLTQNTLVSNVSFFKKLPYDPLTDFEPISLIGTVPLVMAVNAQSPVASVKDLVELARNKRVTYASAGIGSPHHLIMVMLCDATGVQMIHVPYKGGSSAAATALIGGEVDVALSAVTATLPHIKTGRIRPLGLSESQRTPLLPELAPIADSIPGVSLDIWLAVFAPAGTPKPILDRLNTEINRIVRDPEVASSRLTPAGIGALGSTPEHLKSVMKSDIAKYRTIVKTAKITPQ